jgi:hypothetical protein
MRSRFLLAVLLGAFGCSSTTSPAEPAESAPDCAIGAELGSAREAWTLTASGKSAVHASALFGGAVVLLGSYEAELALGDKTAAGGGLFAAWVDTNGQVARLVGLSEPSQRAGIAVARVHGDRLWLVVRFEDEVVLRTEGGSTPIGATGTSHLLVALDSEGRIVEHWRVTGNLADIELASTPTSLIVTGSAYDNVSLTAADAAVVSALEATEESFTRKHGFVFVLEDVAKSWLIDGSADSSIHASAAPTGYYGAGRFGGYGPLSAKIGAGPTLTSVSADDDPAYDAFVTHVGGSGPSWARRIRSYNSEMWLPSVGHAGDLVVAVESHGYATVFDEGEPTEVRITSDKSTFGVLARFGSDGKLRFAREVPPLDALHSDACGLSGAATTGPSAWIANEGKANEIKPEVSGGGQTLLVRLDEEGGIVGVRTPATPRGWMVEPAWPSSWIAYDRTNVDGPLTVTRLDW